MNYFSHILSIAAAIVFALVAIKIIFGSGGG
jgi:hypothetical protein